MGPVVYPLILKGRGMGACISTLGSTKVNFLVAKPPLGTGSSRVADLGLPSIDVCLHSTVCSWYRTFQTQDLPRPLGLVK